MISIMRRFLDTWVARGFFLVMVVAFVIWGIGDVVRLFGTDTWVAKVGGQTIEVPEVQQAFEQQLNDVSRYSELSAGAIQRARELTWDNKVSRISQLYHVVCSSKAGDRAAVC